VLYSKATVVMVVCCTHCHSLLAPIVVVYIAAQCQHSSQGLVECFSSKHRRVLGSNSSDTVDTVFEVVVQVTAALLSVFVTDSKYTSLPTYNAGSAWTSDTLYRQ
jgi:hypothetical protein